MGKGRITMVVLFLFLLAYNTNGQIVNGGFDNWEQVEGRAMATGWKSLNKFRGIEQSSISVNGEYALQFLPCPTNLGRWQYGDLIQQTITSFGKEGDSLSIRFKVKALAEDPENSDLVFAMVFVDYYQSGISHHRDTWVTTTEIPEFTTMELKLNPIPADSIRITLTGGGTAAPNDAPIHCSNVWFDDLVLIDLECERTQNKQISLGPNPTGSIVYLNMECIEIEHIRVFDMSGKQVFAGQLNTSFYELDLSSLPSGAYLISLFKEDHQLAEHRKIIKW